jgi:serine/threonine protein phosphatase PrpC
MQKLPRASKPLLATLATLFAAATALYSVLWMYNVHWGTWVERGFDNEYVAAEHCEPTCTVLGLFDRWECSVAEAELTPGDTLVLYTDGVTEAANAAADEFGEDRLIEILRCQRHLPVSMLLETIVGTVQKFSDGKQADDITLVLARYRGATTDTIQH